MLASMKVEPETPTGLDAWWFLDTLVVARPLANARTPIVLEMTLPAGSAPPLHVHEGYDDVQYLREGCIVMQHGAELSLVEPGGWSSTPRGTPHSFRVMGDQPARVIVVQDAESFLELIKDLGTPAQELRLPPPGLSPSSEDVLRAFDEQDAKVLGPSLPEAAANAFLAWCR
jgi:mannose-6-phosphate isomerase-like protein (cupin superfamily)